MSNTSVYTGLWRDYSRDGVHQHTLTISTTWGGYLISAMALLISLAGTRLWIMIAYVLHQFRVKEECRLDVPHAQTQALLRNSISASAAIIDGFLLLRAWSGTPSRPGARLIPIIGLASLCLVLFTLAGTFISGVATDKNADVTVLADPAACGGWQFNWTAVYASFDSSFESLSVVAQDAMDARAYAKLFYSNDESILIPQSQFPVRSLPYTASKQPCPFKGENRCISNSTSSDAAMTWDSGVLDSHTHLGINAPVHDRIGFRKKLTCAPVNIADLTSVSEDKSSGLAIVNFTGLINEEFEFKTPKHLEGLYGSGYYGSCFIWSGLVKPEGWAAEPFDVDDADLSICFLLQNAVTYSSPVYDPFFLANGSRIWNVSDETQFYMGSNYVNAMGCTEQVQFCNSKTNACTNLTHPAAAVGQFESLDLNTNQITAANRTAMLIGLNGISNLGLGSLGAAGLQASDYIYRGTSSAALPANQWQIEAQLWFETGLALLQAHTLRFLDRIDLSSKDSYGHYLIFTPLDDIPDGPLYDTAETYCYNQKILTNNRYQNFRFFELMLIIAITLSVIIASVLLEPAVGAIRKVFVSPMGKSRQLALDTDLYFWLVKLALEGNGTGPGGYGGLNKDSNGPIVDTADYEMLPRGEETENRNGGAVSQKEG